MTSEGLTELCIFLAVAIAVTVVGADIVLGAIREERGRRSRR